MLKLSGFNLRDWNLMIGSVIFDGSDAHLQKVKRMVYACRYQGFDLSLMLKKIIRLWRDARRQPRTEYRMTYEDGDLTEEWTYLNHESLNNDVTFLIILFLCRGAVISKITKKSARDLLIYCHRYRNRSSCSS